MILCFCMVWLSNKAKMHKTVPNAIVRHRIMVIMIANMDLDHKLTEFPNLA